MYEITKVMIFANKHSVLAKIPMPKQRFQGFAADRGVLPPKHVRFYYGVSLPWETEIHAPGYYRGKEKAPP